MAWIDAGIVWGHDDWAGEVVLCETVVHPRVAPWLEGEDGSKRVLKDLHKNIIRDLDEGKKSRPGKELVLSID